MTRKRRSDLYDVQSEEGPQSFMTSKQTGGIHLVGVRTTKGEAPQPITYLRMTQRPVWHRPSVRPGA